MLYNVSHNKFPFSKGKILATVQVIMFDSSDRAFFTTTYCTKLQDGVFVNASMSQYLPPSRIG